MTKYIAPYSLNNLTGASRNRLHFEKGFVHFKSGTPLELRTPFLSKGGENLSKYKTYVFVDKKNNTLNLRINEIPTTINKILGKLGIIKMNNVKKFELIPDLSTVNKEIKEFISTNSINEFMNNTGFRKKLTKQTIKMLDFIF